MKIKQTFRKRKPTTRNKLFLRRELNSADYHGECLRVREADRANSWRWSSLADALGSMDKDKGQINIQAQNDKNNP